MCPAVPMMQGREALAELEEAVVAFFVGFFMAGASYSDAKEDASTEWLWYFRRMQNFMTKLALLGLVVSGILGSGMAVANDADPFGDYQNIEMFTVGIGPVFYIGDLGDAYELGEAFNMKLVVRLLHPLSLITSFGGALAQGSSSTLTDDKLYYDVGAHLRVKLAGQKSLFVPYLEAGGGFSGLDGPTLTASAGAGFDAQIWEDGSLGLQAFYDYYVGENGAAIPVLLSFSYLL